MKPKARSRLSTSVSPATEKLVMAETNSRPSLKLNISTTWLINWWQPRQPKLTSLLIGLGLYGYLIYLLTHTFPETIRDWLIPGGFLPVIGSAALAHMYVGSFLTLSTRRAILVSIGLTWLLWLQLHRFVVGWEMIGITVGTLIAIDLVWNLIQKITSKTKKYKFQTSAQ